MISIDFDGSMLKGIFFGKRTDYTFYFGRFDLYKSCYAIKL